MAHFEFVAEVQFSRGKIKRRQGRRGDSPCGVSCKKTLDTVALLRFIEFAVSRGNNIAIADKAEVLANST
jgi:hypothetical protein